MANVSMKKLLESGVHFGHRTNKWNPKMKQYIFTERNGIHIIDLSQTVKALNEVLEVVTSVVQDGGNILFVGTKRQAQETIREEAERCGMPYVTERWLGGTLTNWKTIKERIGELERLEGMKESGEIFRLTKKEGLMIQRDIDRLELRLSGVRNMKGLPQLIFVVDIVREATAVHEANLKGIPVIAMVDTNCDPKHVDYVIPSNDDAIRAIKLITSLVAEAVLEGKMMVDKEESEYEDEVAAEMETSRRQRREIKAEEPELSDEDLLGASTLAKIEEEEASDEAEEDVADEVIDEEEAFDDVDDDDSADAE
ncbi:MAG: 30S ribosomal protein S2 [Anaerolineae bacterium]|jgi:small subunit ribosomal protein S2|nr:30S ribosomal protein S2 [Anaerolineae bacterium]